MDETIRRLIELQTIDDKVGEVERERHSLSDKIAKLKGFLANRAAELAEKREKLTEVERFLRELEDEAKQLLDNMKRAQARLGAVTKTKEYNAAQREIDTQKKNVRQKEEEIAKLKEEIAKFRDGYETDEHELQGKRAEVESVERQSAGELGQLQKEITRRAADRDGVEKDVSQAILRRYRRIAKARDGVAVVAVRDGQCTGCNRQVPPQLRIILLKRHTLETCPFCSRYIYAPEDEIQRYTAEDADSADA